MKIKEQISRTVRNLGLVGLLIVNPFSASPAFSQNTSLPVAGSLYQPPTESIEEDVSTSNTKQIRFALKEKDLEDETFYAKIEYISKNPGRPSVFWNVKSNTKSPEYTGKESLELTLDDETHYFNYFIEQLARAVYKVRNSNNPEGRSLKFLIKKQYEPLGEISEDEFVKRQLDKTDPDSILSTIIVHAKQHEEDVESKLEIPLKEERARLKELSTPGNEYFELSQYIADIELLDLPEEKLTEEDKARIKYLPRFLDELQEYCHLTAHIPEWRTDFLTEEQIRKIGEKTARKYHPDLLK